MWLFTQVFQRLMLHFHVAKKTNFDQASDLCEGEEDSTETIAQEDA